MPFPYLRYWSTHCLVCVAAALLLPGAFSAAASVSSSVTLTYPPTKQDDTADTYFGISYKDPYRWLEDVQDKNVATWFKSQAVLTDTILAKIPGRTALVEEWKAEDRLRAAKYADISMDRGRVFYKKTLANENVGKLYLREGWTAPEKILFDPVTYKPDGKTTLQSVLPSFDGKYVVLGLASGGGELSELRVLEVDSGQLLSESFFPSYGPLSWSPDSKAFLYDAGPVTELKDPAFELNRVSRFHHVGTTFVGDADYFSAKKNPELKISPREFAQANFDETCPDYLLGNLGTVQNEQRVYYAPIAGLKNGDFQWKSLCQPSDKLVKSLAFEGKHVYAITHTNAPKYKLVRTLLQNPDWGRAETVIPEGPDSLLYFVRSRNFLYVVYGDGIKGRVLRYDLATGETTPLALPAQGIVDVTVPDWRVDRAVVLVTSWTLPATRFDYVAATGKFARSEFDTAVHYPDFDSIVADEVEVPGHDGVMIPLSIVHRKDLVLDGSTPCILEGYGSYGYSITPYFNLLYSVAGHGVVMAVAHVRGGGEKGEAWYRGGFKTTKSNTWKDFISCAEYLVNKGYTNPQKLAGTGTSAGGILISRAITERPDLFSAAVCNVGCANALRMEFCPNGPVNIPEFGTVKDPAEIKSLAEMDGVAHVVKGMNYPAVLGVGGWNDPRVAVWEPGKFIAALQNSTASGKPALMKINYDDGHFTEEKSVTFNNFATQYAFMLWQTGHQEFQPAL